MKIFIKAKTKAKEEKLQKIGKNHFMVWTKESPDKGKANKAILNILAKNLNVPVSSLEIISGFTSRNKVIKTR